MAAQQETDETSIILANAAADRRIVLVGKTGAGKSASGNTILGRKAFPSTTSSSSVTSECKKEKREFEGQTLEVVDTPGLYDTFTSEDHIWREISKCIFYAAPGPHVFLVVIQAGRFTREEQETVKMIQKMFGEAAADYTMALFTHGDDLRADGVSIEEFINRNPALRDFIRQCKGGYHVFDNRDRDESQVRELLNKINGLVQRNGGRCFTNEMFREAERVINKAVFVILKENPGMEIKEAIKQAESSYTWGVLTSSLTTSGAAIGSVMGPGGTAAGAALGATVGAAVGLTAATLAKNRCKECINQ